MLLRLTSHERLSTHVNPYAGVWTDAVMGEIQRQILEVIRNRAESEAGSRSMRGGPGTSADEIN